MYLDRERKMIETGHFRQSRGTKYSYKRCVCTFPGIRKKESDRWDLGRCTTRVIKASRRCCDEIKMYEFETTEHGQKKSSRFDERVS